MPTVTCVFIQRVLWTRIPILSFTQQALYPLSHFPVPREKKLNIHCHSQSKIHRSKTYSHPDCSLITLGVVSKRKDPVVVEWWAGKSQSNSLLQWASAHPETTELQIRREHIAPSRPWVEKRQPAGWVLRAARGSIGYPVQPLTS